MIIPTVDYPGIRSVFEIPVFPVYNWTNVVNHGKANNKSSPVIIIFMVAISTPSHSRFMAARVSHITPHLGKKRGYKL